jgi:hypothetical protein
MQCHVEGAQRLVTSRSTQVLWDLDRAHYKLVDRQEAGQARTSGLMGVATTAQGVNKEPSPKMCEELDYRQTVYPDGCVRQDDH